MGEPKFTIKIDPDLQDIVPGYLDKRKKDIPVLEDAIGRADYDLLTTMGHKLKGSGGGYGFIELGSLGADLEIAGKAKEINKAKEVVEKIKQYLLSVEVSF